MEYSRKTKSHDKISTHFSKIYKLIGGLVILFSTTPVLADWSLNIGYHNPPQAGLGVNFLYSWTQAAIELGIGHIGSDANFSKDDKNNDGVALGLGGDINGKLFFLQSSVRPYLQLGTLLGTYGSIGDNSGIGLGGNALFFGGGLWIGKPSAFHGYVSYNLIGGYGFLQAGLGFDI